MRISGDRVPIALDIEETLESVPREAGEAVGEDDVMCASRMVPQQAPATGDVVLVGPGAFRDGKRQPMNVAVGERARRVADMPVGEIQKMLARERY